MSYYNYKLPPISQKPVEQMKKYFYTVLFIKSYIYNVKGQAIIFRRKSLDSLIKLLNDFDETYLHSSYEHSYQNKVLAEGNVDFLVKYTDNLDNVINLIDQNAFVIKLSWQCDKIPSNCPSFHIEPPTLYDCYYNKTNDAQLDRLQMLIQSVVDRSLKAANKRVKITKLDIINGVAEIRDWDENKQKFTSLEYTVKLDTNLNWEVGEVASLVNGKFLQKTSFSYYKRVKVTNVDRLTSKGIICVREFDDKIKQFIGEQQEINLSSYCYGDKIPSWHVNDDALLFDNKYLQKLDIPEVYGFNGTGNNGNVISGINFDNFGPSWSNVPGSEGSGDDQESDSGSINIDIDMGSPIEEGAEEFGD